MARRKVSHTVYLTQEQTEALAVLSKQSRVPTAVRIRDAVDAMLAKCGEGV